MNSQQPIKPGENIIFYDGVCGFCNKFVQFILSQGAGLNFLFCSLQSEVAARLLSKFGQTNKDLDSIFVITDYDLPSGKLLKKSKAVFFILEHCNKPWHTLWPYLSIFKFLPQFILDFGYDLVASFRYKIFGRYESCLLPEKEVRDRFIDQ
jgi:predicted DCC family thiol-disulfide oxidoreductase YuxK